MDLSSLLLKRSNLSLFVGIALIFIAIIIIGFIAIESQQHKTEQEITSGLNTIAELKAASISGWYHERLGDANVSVKSQTLIEYLRNQETPGQYEITRSDLSEWMQGRIANYQYQGIFLLNKTGSILVAEPVSAILSNMMLNITLQKAINAKKAVFTDLYIQPETGNVTMEFWVPIQSRNDESPAGVLVLQINPDEYLYPLIQSWPTGSRTAESLITRQVGDSILFLNELRHLPDAALRLTVPMSEENVPAVMAAQGFRGIVKGNDYRGVPVVASITNISGTPWFIIAKIDQEEIYAPFSQIIQLTIGGIFLLLCIAGLGFLFVWKTRENEFVVQELHQKQQELYLSDRIRLLMQQANDAIFIMDKDWHILEVNDRAVEMYGYTPDEFQEKILFDLRSESAKGDVPDDIRQMGDSEGYLFKTEHQKKDGTIFPVEDSVRAVLIQGTLYRQAIVHDITDQKAIEIELLDKNIELQSMNEEISASYEELASQQEELRDQMETLRQSEIQLQELQNRLSDAQKAGHVGVFEYYLGSHLIWGSDEAFKIYGFAPDAKMLMNIEEVLTCIPDRSRVESLILDVIERNIPYNIEYLIHPADGSPDRIVSTIGTLHKDRGGNPVKIVGIVQDITEKREYEEEIRNYQEKLSALFSSQLLGILFGDIYGSIHQASDEFLRIIGYSREDFTSGTIRWTDITPAEFLSIDERGIAQAKENGSCIPYQKQFIRKDGSRVWVLLGYILVEPAREESVAFILDISDAKKNEEAISTLNLTLEERVIERTNQLTFINEELQTEVEERLSGEKKLQEALSILSATFESTEDGILVVNAAGQVTLYNKMFLDMWHLPEEVMWPQDERTILHEMSQNVIDSESFCNKVASIHAQPDSETFDLITLSDNRIFERYSKPQRIGYVIVGRVWSFRDVTKRKEMEIQIEKSLREKEILLKEIHHRVKNNMQVVSSLLFMQSRLASDENLKEILLESQSRVKSIALVHEELYQSMSLDQIDYNRYLHKLSRNIFDTYKVDTGRISLQLSDETVYVTISKAVPCSLIINELISNSLKHAFPDERTGRIIISFTLAEGTYHLGYADTGIGIPESTLHESPKTLGLELIKGLVKQLSGTITTSQTDGTRYDIVFPE